MSLRFREDLRALWRQMLSARVKAAGFTDVDSHAMELLMHHCLEHLRRFTAAAVQSSIARGDGERLNREDLRSGLDHCAEKFGMGLAPSAAMAEEWLTRYTEVRGRGPLMDDVAASSSSSSAPAGSSEGPTALRRMDAQPPALAQLLPDPSRSSSGTPLWGEMSFCRNCGQERSGGYHFCSQYHLECTEVFGAPMQPIPLELAEQMLGPPQGPSGVQIVELDRTAEEPVQLLKDNEKLKTHQKELNEQEQHAINVDDFEAAGKTHKELQTIEAQWVRNAEEQEMQEPPPAQSLSSSTAQGSKPCPVETVTTKTSTMPELLAIPAPQDGASRMSVDATIQKVPEAVELPEKKLPKAEVLPGEEDSGAVIGKPPAALQQHQGQQLQRLFDTVDTSKATGEVECTESRSSVLPAAPDIVTVRSESSLSGISPASNTLPRQVSVLSEASSQGGPQRSVESSQTPAPPAAARPEKRTDAPRSLKLRVNGGSSQADQTRKRRKLAIVGVAAKPVLSADGECDSV